jgi:hypothetical protein
MSQSRYWLRLGGFWLATISAALLCANAWEEHGLSRWQQQAQSMQEPKTASPQ